MLNKETILLKTNNGLDVFRHFIHGEWKIGKNFLNPFYPDKKASCNIYRDKRTKIYKINDFGDNRFSGDCFALVGTLYQLDCKYKQDFSEIMKIIDSELNLCLSGNKTNSAINKKISFSPIPQKAPVPSIVEPSSYLPITKEFSSPELKYWGQYGITQTILETFDVLSIASYTAENKEKKSYTVKSSIQEPIFAYRHLHFIKIYRPLSKLRFQYLGNKTEHYIFGLEQIPPKGDILFITGGEKDVMCMYAHGFNSIAFNSENANIPPEVIKKLSYRFKHIVLLYDTDQTGIESSLKHFNELKDFDMKRLILPLPGTKEEKDISDYFRLGNTREQLKKLFTDLLNDLYAETFAMLKSCEIDFKNPPVTPEPLITINGVTIGSPGNLLGITGNEGSGKSNFLGGIVAGAIRLKGDIVDSLGTDVKINEQGKAILYYDTEQSEDQLYRNLTYILKRCNREQPPKYFKAYCLTNMGRRERLHVITQSMDKFHHQFNGIHMVVIDGIGDLIRGLNDEADSVQLIEELHRLAGIYKTCIICVLHLVPNGIKLRGHLGSELQRKSAGILCIEKEADTDISYIKALKVRSGSPLDVPLLQFAWDKQKNHHVFIGEKSKEYKDQRKVDDLQALAEDIFAEKETYSYTQLVSTIQDIMEVKSRTAKSYVRFMKEKNIIVKHPSFPTQYLKSGSKSQS
ncbi:MAG: bifunctional DNA primase/helicase [Bacteroidetes bacterium]|nr:bifunctional DNA primase/helicase [Bacteroidota bacterium]